MSTRLLPLTSALPAALLLAACGAGPEGPLGPNGGSNRVVITVDQADLDMDAVGLSAESSTTTVTLIFTGSVDPLKDAVDDEYGYVLSLDLDPAALAALSAPAALSIDGTTTFEGRPEGGAVRQSWQPTATSAAAIQGVLLRRSCFCGDFGAGTQTAQGSLTFTRVQPGATLSGQLELTIQGEILNMSEAHTVRFDVEFDLTVRPVGA
jgi:hypothetical protein